MGRRHSDRIIAASESSERTLEQATRSARTGAPVLITGEGGTGRKHIARAIHAWSDRSAGPLVIFPVSSSPESQHDRDLFGSANSVSSLSGDHDGCLARSAQGTLLIHGIDCLDPSVRTRLVEAIQSGSFTRPGRPDPIRVGARIIATAEGDEQSWLGGLPIQNVNVTPLTSRREDVLPLCAHFLAEFSEEIGVRPIGFTSDARNWLIEETWPGNVRELRERIRQALRLSTDGVISAEALMLAIDGEEVPSFKQAKRAFETRYVEGLLRRCGGNISRAARLAKKDRKDFYDVIRRTGVDPSQFRS